MGSLTVETITHFIEEAGKVLFACSSVIRDVLRELILECEFQFNEEEESVIGHFKHDVSGEGQHTKLLITSDNLIYAPATVVQKENNSSLWDQGTLL